MCPKVMMMEILMMMMMMMMTNLLRMVGEEEVGRSREHGVDLEDR